MITKDEKENVGLSVDATKDEKLGFLVCGALGQEILDIINKNSWMADVNGIPAIDHSFPERIAPDVEKRILEYKSKYKRLIVVYGDCGTRCNLLLWHISYIRTPIVTRCTRLKIDYFKNYKRVVYLTQRLDPEYQKEAERISECLILPLEICFTGYGLLEERLLEVVNNSD